MHKQCTRQQTLQVLKVLAHTPTVWRESKNSTLLDAAELERFNITRVDDRLYQTTPLSRLHPNVTGPGQQEVLVRYIYYTSSYLSIRTFTYMHAH